MKTPELYKGIFEEPDILDFGEGPGKPAQSAPQLQARPLLSFQIPEPDDASILVGNRYLSQGDGAILVSTSSMGKSSLATQIALSWSLGRPAFDGLRPARPLRSLIIQSEDSDGDVAEVGQSLIHAMHLTPGEVAQVNDRVLVVTDRIHRGPAFITELKRQISTHQPDIVWINPLLAFIDGDVNDAEAVGRFLREGLNGLNEPAKFAYVLVHHTAKPPKEKTERRWNEVMYDMAGSADLTNWARAVISLRAREKEGEFDLVFAKRGGRTGMTRKEPGKINPGMEFDVHTNVINIRHSKDRMPVKGYPNGMPVIHWERFDAESPPPKAAVGGRPSKYAFTDFVSCFPKWDEEPLPLAQIHRKVMGLSGIPISSFKDLCIRAYKDGLLERSEKPAGHYVFRLTG